MYSKDKKNIAYLHTFLYSAEQNATHIEEFTDTLKKALNGYEIMSIHRSYKEAQLAVRKFLKGNNGYDR